MAELREHQQQAYEQIRRHILVGRYAKINTLQKQRFILGTLNRRDALAVAGAIVDEFGGALSGPGTAHIVVADAAVGQ